MHCVVEDHEVYVWPRLVDAQTLEEIAALVSWKNADDGGEIFFHTALAEQISAMLPPLPEYVGFKGWTHHVTVGKPLPTGGPWHIDRPYGARWKACIYLDEVPDGGTEFGQNERFCPPTPKGTVVMFEIGLIHRSRKFSRRYTKRVIGLRAY